MYLKSLEIHGFKSFAEKTVLTFLPPTDGHQSVTAIVGPNGSGKSNIADAIRWVLGEQSVKNLRGKKGEDVIFSGSEAKGKMGLASVSLTIDNADHLLALEYDELVLTRRLYRSGESEYLVNGHTARLMDIELLLARAQFAQDSYSIVGQGMIDRMLLQNSAERLQFFDEASGIKELQLKRRQAALKLARTREHLTQALLLADEVAPRLKLLSRQVKKLEERQTVELQLREIQESYYGSVWQELVSQMNARRGQMAVYEAERQVRANQVLAIQTEMASLMRAVQEGSNVQALRQEYDALMKEKNAVERERVILEGKIQSGFQQIGQHERGWMEQRLSDCRAREIELLRDVEMVTTRVKDAQTAVTVLETEIKRVRTEFETITKRCRALEESMQRPLLDERVWQGSAVKAVQALMHAQGELGTIYGTIASLGSVDERYRLALEVAAGGHLSSLVVADDGVAERSIQYLRTHALGVATFLPLNKVEPRRLPGSDYQGHAGVIGIAAELVAYDERLAPAFQHILGNTLIVESIDVARKLGIGSVRMVTLDGDVVERGGSMKGGYRKAGGTSVHFSGGRSVLSQKEEDIPGALDAARRELLAAEMTLRRLEADVQTKQTEYSVAAEKRLLLSQALEERARERQTLADEYAAMTASPDAYEGVLASMKEKKQVLDATIARLTDSITTQEQHIATAEAEAEAKKQRVFVLQEEMQAAQAAVTAVTAQKSTEEIELAKLETRAEDVSHEVLQETKSSIQAIAARGVPPTAIADMEAANITMQKLKYQLSLIGGIDPAVVAEYEATKSRHESLVAQLTDLEKAADDLTTLIAELDEMMKKQRDQALKRLRQEFARYFTLLFDGGKADLIDVYGQESVSEELSEEGEGGEGVVEKKKPAADVLVGIDIVACPPGKKSMGLHALSGGERTLTSIALICAILRVNPSPFVLLDEVEAALDEANTLRFTGILKELAERSQFILITHNRATMHAADALYGVTMNQDGLSRLMSVSLAS